MGRPAWPVFNRGAMSVASGEANEILRRYWGYPEFRPGQSKAVASALEGRDTLVIMPTGGGKSVCYQVPSMVLPGVTIVVSPLISLMKDWGVRCRRPTLM